MQQLDRYKKIEIELTSHCNLACPGCTRTWRGDTNPRLPLSSIPYEVFIDRLQPDDLKNKEISFCGVYGDPLMHKDFFEITKYCLESKANVIVDTNASLRSTKWWQQLGELGKQYGSALLMRFSVDGHKQTNHLYRVKSDFDKILANMKAYTTAGGYGQWKYIVFPHNEDEIDLARQEAKKLGINIRFEKNNREPDKNWPTYEMIENKTNVNEVFGKLNQQNKTSINYTKNDVTKKLNITETIHDTEKSTKKIKCEWLDEDTLFIGYDGKVWPCCYFAHDYHQYYLLPHRAEKWRKTGEYLHKLDHYYGKDWNNINSYSLEKILNSSWYTVNLKESLTTNPQSACVFNCEK